MNTRLGFCFNCDKEVAYDRARKGKLFCSEKCQQTADAVRYGRATCRDGRYARDPKVREALTIKIGLVLGGGYPEQERRLTSQQRDEILTRDNHTCRICGQPATTIDHINGSSNNPDNLQSLCSDCHNRKTVAAMVPAGEEEAAEARKIWTRIKAEHSQLPCDDEVNWKTAWRDFSSQLKQMCKELKEEQDELNVDPDIFGDAEEQVSFDSAMYRDLMSND